MREIHLYSMSTGVYEGSGKCLPINYGMVNIPYGEIFIAETSGRVVHLSLTDDFDNELKRFKSRWYLSSTSHQPDQCQRLADSIFAEDTEYAQARLLLMGNDLQCAVWSEVARIPKGSVASYSDIAERIGKPDSERFVANIVVDNPVAYLVPCHRVVRHNGTLGSYRWGQESKRKLLKAEGCNPSHLDIAV